MVVSELSTVPFHSIFCLAPSAPSHLSIKFWITVPGSAKPLSSFFLFISFLGMFALLVFQVHLRIILLN